MNNLCLKIMGVVCFISMAGCASASQTFTWQDIKQQVGPVVPKAPTVGYLQVFTKDETVNDGGYLWQRGPRYLIYTANGKRITWSENDGGPNTFTLAPGKYVIVPYDREYRNEITGAILEPGKVTEVHMMGG